MSKINKRRKQKDDEDWMTTYADAVTLLLCFLVLLISVSEPKEAEFKQVQAAFLKAVESEIESPFTDLYNDIQSMISENRLESMMSVEETENGLIVEIASSSFYEPGSATFRDIAIPVLLDLAILLEDFDYEDYIIEVEGHTDDSPMSGKNVAFPTNWELSAGRASRVVRFFTEENLSHERMRVKAFADTVPKVPNLDDSGMPIPENREINRRIAIKVERNTD